MENGDNTCNLAFLKLNAVHDYCPHTDLIESYAELVHDWEDFCLGCKIAKPYDASIPDCTQPTCSDVGIAQFVAEGLSDCTPEGGDGTCCRTAGEKSAYRMIYAYHEMCEHDEVPEIAEDAVHDYGEACEDERCNVVGPGVNPLVCAPPAGSGSSDDDDIALKVVVPVVAVLIVAGILGAIFAYRRGAKYATLQEHGVVSGNPSFGQ